MTIQKCTINDCKYLAELNKELINAERSDNPMTIEELEERMENFLQTTYEAFFFVCQGCSWICVGKDRLQAAIVVHGAVFR